MAELQFDARIQHLKKPVIITGLTTIVGILGLATHIMIPAKQMGIVAAIGILVALFLSLVFIPAVLSGMKKGKSINVFQKENKNRLSKILNWFAQTATNKPKRVIYVFIKKMILSKIYNFFDTIIFRRSTEFLEKFGLILKRF